MLDPELDDDFGPLPSKAKSTSPTPVPRASSSSQAAEQQRPSSVSLPRTITGTKKPLPTPPKPPRPSIPAPMSSHQGSEPSPSPKPALSRSNTGDALQNHKLGTEGNQIANSPEKAGEGSNPSENSSTLATQGLDPNFPPIVDSAVPLPSKTPPPVEAERNSTGSKKAVVIAPVDVGAAKILAGTDKPSTTGSASISPRRATPGLSPRRAAAELNRAADGSFNPLLIYTRTLLDEYDLSPLSIPDMYLPNYNTVGFRYAPDTETIGTRLRLLTLLADDDDLIDRFGVSESPFNYYDYSSVQSPYQIPITNFVTAPIPYQWLHPSSTPHGPSTTPIVNPALAHSFNNLKRLFTSGNQSQHQNQNPSNPLHSSSTTLLPLRGPKSVVRQTRPAEPAPLPPGFDPYMKPKSTAPVLKSANSSNTLRGPEASEVHSAPAANTAAPKPKAEASSSSGLFIVPVSSNEPDIYNPSEPVSTPAVVGSLQYNARKSRRNAAAFNPREIPVFIEEENSPPVEIDIVLDPVESAVCANPPHYVGSFQGLSPESHENFRVSMLLSKPLGEKEEEVFRRHRGVSLAEDKLLEKLNDFGNLEDLLDFNPEAQKDPKDTENPQNGGLGDLNQ